MNVIIAFALLAITVYCSYRLAKEKQQNHIVWPLITVIVGPMVFIVQYLSTIIGKKSIA